MSKKRWVWRIRYCRHHQMVYHPNTRRWTAVPPDFLRELRQAALPVTVVRRRCPRCDKQNPGGLKTP